MTDIKKTDHPDHLLMVNLDRNTFYSKLRKEDLLIKEIKATLNLLAIPVKISDMVSWKEVRKFILNLEDELFSQFYKAIMQKLEREKKVEFNQEVIDEIINIIYEYGKILGKNVKFPLEAGCQTFFVNCLNLSAIKASEYLVVEKRIALFSPGHHVVADAYFSNYDLPIEMKRDPGPTYRKRSQREKEALGQAFLYSVPCGKALILFFTNDSKYARTLEKKYKKLSNRKIYFRVIDWSRFNSSIDEGD